MGINFATSSSARRGSFTSRTLAPGISTHRNKALSFVTASCTKDAARRANPGIRYVLDLVGQAGLRNPEKAVKRFVQTFVNLEPFIESEEGEPQCNQQPDNMLALQENLKISQGDLMDAIRLSQNGH